MDAIIEPRCLSMANTARYLDCSPAHVHNLVAAGVLVPVVWPSTGTGVRTRLYFDRLDLDKAIEHNKQRATTVS